MFIFAAFMFNFILQLSYLVTEKELRLREAMKQMGMRTSAYWTSWLITNTCLNLIQGKHFFHSKRVYFFPLVFTL